MRDGAVVARRAHNPKVIGSSPVPATFRLRMPVVLVRAGIFAFTKLLKCGGEGINGGHRFEMWTLILNLQYAWTYR